MLLTLVLGLWVLEPSLALAWSGSITPDQPYADLPTGYSLVLQADADERPPSSVQLTLPPGTDLSPTIGGDLELCSAAEFAVSDLVDPPACPPASKLADVSIDLPPLGGGPHLDGEAFIGEPTFGASGDSYPLEIAASLGGQWVKLVGQVQLNQPGVAPGTVSASFSLSRTPIARMAFQFRGGNDAVLVNPERCGTTTGNAAVTDVDGTVHQVPLPLQITAAYDGSPCATPPFGPRLSTSASTYAPGRPVVLEATIDRPDGQAHIQTLRVMLPSGMSTVLSAASICPLANASAGTCPATLAIGHIIATVGSGPGAISLPGSVFLTQGAAGGLAMSFAIPARVGPLDLGTVVIAAAIGADSSGRLTIAAGLPSFYRGIPLVLRQFQMTIDRPGFLLNPRTCGPLQFSASFSATDGASAQSQQPYPLVCPPPKLDPLSGVRIAPRRFAPLAACRLRRRRSLHCGATLSYLLRVPAQVRRVLAQRTTKRRCVRTNRRRTRCRVISRWHVIDRLTEQRSAGIQSERLGGMLRGRPLAAGRYRLTLSASASTGNGAAHTISFTILAPRPAGRRAKH